MANEFVARNGIIALNNTQITGSLNVSQGITGSLFGTSSYATNALTASYFSGSISNSTSASYAATASYANSFTVGGTITAQTLIVQTITASVEYSSGSNVFGNSTANTQQFTGSVLITGSLAVNGSNAILSNQTSSMSVATASYVTLAQTASYVVTAQTASYVLQAVSASFASTASSINALNQNVLVTGSFTTNADTLLLTGSLIITGSSILTGSLNVSQGGITGSLFGTASYAINALTASYLSGYVSPFPYTGSAIITGSLQVIGNITQYNSSSYIGSNAGSGSVASTSSIYIGDQAGLNAASSSNAVFLGAYSGLNASGSVALTAIGYQAGISMSNAGNSTAVGTSAGYGAANAIGSAFFGIYAGAAAANSSYSTFIGPYAGWRVSGSSYSTFIGYNAGFNSALGNNNILVGTNVTLASGSTNSINIGGLIFGSGSYFSTSSASSGSANGYVGINQPNPLYNLDVSGSARVSGILFGTASYALNVGSTGTNATASFTTQSTWTFTHNLNNQNVIVQTYDLGYNQIIPQNIQLTNVNTAVITFPISASGYAVASMGGVSGQAVSASYALTASYAVNGGGGGNTGIVTFNLQTGSYTLAASDVSKIVRISSSVSCSVTLPDNTSVPMATGSFITIEQAGSGSVTAITGSGVTILPSARTTFGQYKIIQCYKIDTNIWNVLGGIV